tara:strand:+ start:1079 stop:1384 length:306 start_codon:yes stop_codon:yes gene_type:complete
MIDTEKYEGHTEGPWKAEYGDYTTHVTNSDGVVVASVGFELDKDGQLVADAPLLLAEVKRLRNGIRSILSDYDIIELIRDVPADEWNFEQQALVRMMEMIV